MKKIISFLWLVLCLVGCSEDVQMPSDIDGVYNADALDLEVNMQIKDSKCYGFAISFDGENWYKWDDVTTSGKYPNFTYSVSALTVKAHFLADGQIEAALNGLLRYESGGGLSSVNFDTWLDHANIVFTKQ